jgi:hypothetical protein
MSHERHPPREPVLPRTDEDEARKRGEPRERTDGGEPGSRERTQEDEDAREQGKHGYLHAFTR